MRTATAGNPAPICFACFVVQRSNSVRSNVIVANHCFLKAGSQLIPKLSGSVSAAKGASTEVIISAIACCNRLFLSGATCFSGKTFSRKFVEDLSWLGVSP